MACIPPRELKAPRPNRALTWFSLVLTSCRFEVKSIFFSRSFLPTGLTLFTLPGLLDGTENYPDLLDPFFALPRWQLHSNMV